MKKVETTKWGKLVYFVYIYEIIYL
jgi:hypothetical protein